MSDIYVYSTLTNSQNYAVDGGKKVFIQGGANTPGARMPDGVFVTSRGAVTKITAEQYAALKANVVFQLHEKNGYLSFENSKQDVEKVTADMKGRDESAPDTESDAEADGRKVRKPRNQG